MMGKSGFINGRGKCGYRLARGSRHSNTFVCILGGKSLASVWAMSWRMISRGDLSKHVENASFFSHVRS